MRNIFEGLGRQIDRRISWSEDSVRMLVSGISFM